MSIIILLITISLTIAIVFLVSFYWSMKSGQYDDTYTPSVRMLFDDQKHDKKDVKNLDSNTEAKRSDEERPGSKV